MRLEKGSGMASKLNHHPIPVSGDDHGEESDDRGSQKDIHVSAHREGFSCFGHFALLYHDSLSCSIGENPCRVPISHEEERSGGDVHAWIWFIGNMYLEIRAEMRDDMHTDLPRENARLLIPVSDIYLIQTDPARTIRTH
jgi:hypothetical protein